MKNIPIMINGETSLNAEDFNQIPLELENVISGANLSLDGNDLNQLGKVLTKSACVYDFYEDTGTENSIVLNATNSQPLKEYVNGLKVRFYTSNTNSGALTVNIDGIGVKKIVILQNPTEDLTAGYIVANRYYDIIFNSLIDKFIIQQNGLGLKIWNGRETVVSTDKSPNPYIGSLILTIDLTNIPMINEDGTITHMDLSKKQYIYYSFDFEYQMTGNNTSNANSGSISINRNNANGINLLKGQGYFNTANNNFSLEESVYATALLDVKGNSETFYRIRTGQNIVGNYSDKIYILGWVD